MVSAPVSGSSGPVSSPGRGQCVVSLGRHFTLVVPLSSQMYKWVPANLNNARSNPVMDWHPIPGGVEIFLVTSCFRNQDKFRPDWSLSSYADFTVIKY